MSRVRLFPTRHSLVLGLILLAMLLAAVNYDNNLVYLILFWLVGMVMVSAVYSHRNLALVEVKEGACWPVFAGSDLRFGVQVRNNATSPVSALTMRVRVAGKETVAYLDEIAPGDTELVELVVEVPRRGLFQIEEAAVESEFPLGILGVRRLAKLRQPYVVYPELKGDLPFPDIVYDAKDQDSGIRSGGDDFYGVRSYTPGEPQRHIDWKAVARGLPLMVKQFTGGGAGRLWFPWAALEGMETEARLSQLAHWIVQADEQNLHYGLILPGHVHEPEKSKEHRHRLLRALAVYRRDGREEPQAGEGEAGA